MKPLRKAWAQRRYGADVLHPSGMPLSNLRFADDILLFSSSLPALQDMLKDLIPAAQACGLELHPDKTKILTNGWGKRHRKAIGSWVEIAGVKLEILPRDTTTKYLGRSFSFHSPNDTELQGRINAGWRKFAVYKDELRNKAYPLKQRLRLFDAVVTPSVLYDCTSWTLTAELEGRLRKAQQRMLRMILNSGRRRVQVPTSEQSSEEESEELHSPDSEDADHLLEPWGDWIRRTARHVESELENAKLEDWTAQAKRRK